jgi:hypothetical protein
MNGALFLGVSALICIGVFLNGLRFARMSANPFAGRRLFGMPVQGYDMSVERLNLLGRFQMIGAIMFLLVVAALCFGLFGPVDGITVIGAPSRQGAARP